jgi:hypothetical protein
MTDVNNHTGKPGSRRPPHTEHPPFPHGLTSLHAQFKQESSQPHSIWHNCNQSSSRHGSSAFHSSTQHASQLAFGSKSFLTGLDLRASLSHRLVIMVALRLQAATPDVRSRALVAEMEPALAGDEYTLPALLGDLSLSTAAGDAAAKGPAGAGVTGSGRFAEPTTGCDMWKFDSKRRFVRDAASPKARTVGICGARPGPVGVAAARGDNTPGPGLCGGRGRVAGLGPSVSKLQGA